MSTYVQLSEDEPIVDLVSQIESTLNESTGKPKTSEKEDVKSPSVNTPEADDEEEDEEEEKEKDDEKEEKDEEKDEEEADDEEEEPRKKKKAPKVTKKAPEPKPKEDSAWMTLAKENKILEVLDQAFFPSFQKLISTNEAEAESVLFLVFFVLQNLAEKNKSDLKSRVSKLTSLLSEIKEKENKDSESNDEILLLRLRWFSVLHDSFSDEKHPDLRYSTFTAFLNFAAATKQTGHIIDHLTFVNYEKVVKLWKLTVVEQRDFSLLLINIHTQHQQDNSLPAPSEETQKIRIQYLKNWEIVQKGEDIDKTSNQALAAIVDALLNNNLVGIHTLLTLRAVNNLEKHKDHKRALRLLTIFAKETADSYEKFYKENTSYITELGLNHKKLLSHIRALTLCSLGATSPTLSYLELRKAFGVKDDNLVEEIVLDAVVEGRVEAKVDQEKSEVVVYRTSPRSFDQSSWQNLSVQLETWKENVSQVLSILQRAQQTQQPVPPPSRR